MENRLSKKYLSEVGNQAARNMRAKGFPEPQINAMQNYAANGDSAHIANLKRLRDASKQHKPKVNPQDNTPETPEPPQLPKQLLKKVKILNKGSGKDKDEAKLIVANQYTNLHTTKGKGQRVARVSRGDTRYTVDDKGKIDGVTNHKGYDQKSDKGKNRSQPTSFRQKRKEKEDDEVTENSSRHNGMTHILTMNEWYQENPTTNNNKPIDLSRRRFLLEQLYINKDEPKDWEFKIQNEGMVVEFNNKFSPILEMAQHQANKICRDIRRYRDEILMSLHLIPDTNNRTKSHKIVYESIAKNLYELSDNACDHYSKGFDITVKNNLDFVIQKSEELSIKMIDNIDNQNFQHNDTKKVVLEYDEIEEVAASYLNVYQMRQMRLIGKLFLASWRR